MEKIEQSIEVDAPVRLVYNQWTQFEEFPEFMEGVEEVRQLDDKRLHWVASIGGKRHEWDAEILEQIPDERIAWRATAGKKNAGQVSFDQLADDRTRVRVLMSYEPEGAIEKAVEAVGLVAARVKSDLKKFKQFVESRPKETGGWRGKIRGREVISESEAPRSQRMREEPRRPD